MSENTMISYLYRDASNYKVHNQCVIDGVLNDDQIDRIMASLQDGEYFVPSAVGLTETKFASETEDDHPFFELWRDGFETVMADPDVQTTPEELVTAFTRIGPDGWDEIAATDLLKTDFVDAVRSLAATAVDRGVDPKEVMKRLASREPACLVRRASAMLVMTAAYMSMNRVTLPELVRDVTEIAGDRDALLADPDVGPALGGAVDE